MHLIRSIIEIITVIAFLIAAAFWAGAFISEEGGWYVFGAVIFSFGFIGFLFIHLVLMFIHKMPRKK